MQRISFSFLVLALASSLVACSSVDVVEPVPDTLSGSVVNQWGDPAAGVRVAAGAALATTDEAGHFEVPAVDSPYDLTLFDPGAKIAHVYIGLTDQSPSFRIDGTGTSAPTQARAASFTVKFPEKDSGSLLSAFTLDFIDKVTRQSFSVDSPSQFTAQERTIMTLWSGPKAVTARLQAFHMAVDPLSGAIQHYVGYDSVEVSVTEGVPSTVAVSWKPPPFGDATISVTPKLVGSLVVAYDGEVGIRSPGGISTQRLGYGAMQGSELSFVVPDISEATFDVSFNAGDSSGVGYAAGRIAGLVPGAKGAILAVEPPAEQVSPHDGGAFGIGTSLEWLPKSAGASVNVLSPQDQTTGNITYYVATEGGATVVPDLSSLGLSLSKGQKYDWTVFRSSQTRTVDDIAAKFMGLDPSTEPSYDSGSSPWTLTSQ